MRVPQHSADSVWGQQAEQAWVAAQTGANARAAHALHALLLRARTEDPAERISAADLAAGAYNILQFLLAPPADAS